jgi:hypothetical protein
VAGGITDAPFRVNPANLHGGLEYAVQFSQQSFYDSTVNDDYNTLVRTGGGRAVCKSIAVRAFSNSYFFITGSSGNLLGNGGFEGATLAPWSASGSGASALDSSHITGKRLTSAKSAKLTVAAATNYAQVAQTVAIRPGQLAMLQAWARGDGIAGHNGQVKVEFLDASGASIAGGPSSSSQVVSESAAWALYRCAARAPAGAVSAFVTLNCSRSTSDGSVFYDEAVLNIV